MSVRPDGQSHPSRATIAGVFLSPRLGGDLAWYLNDAASAVGGLRCSFGAQLERAALRLGLSFDSAEVPSIPSAFGLGGRSLAPKRALERLAGEDRARARDPGHVPPLVAYYGAAQAVPDEIREKLGCLGLMTFVAVLTPTFRVIKASMPDALTNLDVIVRVEPGHPLLTLCRAQADVMLRRACAAYMVSIGAGTRLEVPRVRRVQTGLRHCGSGPDVRGGLEQPAGSPSPPKQEGSSSPQRAQVPGDAVGPPGHVAPTVEQSG